MIVLGWISSEGTGPADRRDEVVGDPSFKGTGNQLTGSQNQGILDGLVDDLDVSDLNR